MTTLEGNFDQRASSYDANAWHVVHAQRLVDLAALKPGMRVLDAATGTGHAAFAAANTVGPDGSVVGVDTSAEMLKRAELEKHRRGKCNVSLIQCDASALPQFEAASFDAVVCSAGLLYMDIEPALSEWHRLLKPGALLAFSSMLSGSPPAAELFRRCAFEFGLRLDDPSARLGSQYNCETVVVKAGFTLREIVQSSVTFTRADLALAFEANRQSAGHGLVRTLNQAQLALLKDSYKTALTHAIEHDASIFEASVLYVYALRPSA